MHVTVKFLGALRDQAGAPLLTLDLPAEGTYRDVLNAIGPMVQAKFEASAWDPAKQCLSRRMIVSLNGASGPRDETAYLAEGDEILVASPLAGG